MVSASERVRAASAAFRVRTWVLVLLMLVVGLTMTAVAGVAVRAQQRERQDATNRIALERATAVIDGRMEYYVAALRGLGGLVTASDEVTRGEFAAYVAVARIQERYPGVQALQLTRAVDADAVTGFERRVRAEGFPDFAVHPDSDAPTRYVVDYIEPLTGNEAAFGLDLSATPDRLESVELARDSGTTVASTGVTLVQSGERGFLLLQAIYADDAMPATVAERRQAFRGLVNGVFRLEGVLDDTLSREVAGHVEIYDGGAVRDPVIPHGAATLLYDSDDRMTAPVLAPDVAELGQVVVGGRRWLVYVDAGAQVDPWLVSLVVAGGALLTAALTALVLSLSRSRARAEAIAARRTVDLARRADELRDARDRALAADRAKSEFLSNVSHELRTPLNGILGTYQLLDQAELDAGSRRYLSLGRRSATELLAIVDDILDLSRIEAGSLELDRDVFAVREVAAEVVAHLRPPADEKGLALHLSIGDGVPAWVVGDRRRLRQVLLSLVDNAIKFTEHGGVTLAVDRFGEQHLAFAVEDTGAGVAEADRDRIFRPFEQADLSTTKAHAGTGLGLPIVSRLVALMGGDVSLDSTVGVGSTFAFTAHLPAAERPAAEPAGDLSDPGATQTPAAP